jgi:hypothetical protein
MMIDLKSRLRPLLQDSFIWDALKGVSDRRQVKAWEGAGKPAPVPHAIKRDIVAREAETYGTQTLIETGTFYGDMIYAMRGRFKQIISIELSDYLAKKAMRRFQRYPHIQIVQGDSAKALPQILATKVTACIFWLDGHASGGVTAGGGIDYCPVWFEVNAILEHGNKGHVILIDDAGFFDGTGGYPTLNQMRELVAEKGLNHVMSIENHVIRILPRSAN